MQTTNRRGLWPSRKVSRRSLIRAAGGVAVGSAGLAVAAACGGGNGNEATATAIATQATQTDVSGLVGPLEQHRQRRWGTGLKGWDPDQAFDGFTVFTTIESDAVHLVDMMGEEVHTWSFIDPDSDRTMWYACMLPNGNLFAIVQQLTGDAPPFIFKGGVTMEVDWDGNIVWELEDLDQHHDATLLPNGNVLVLRTEVIPADYAARVPGGYDTDPPGEPMWGDYVVERTLDGEVVWEWHAWEHLEPEAYPLNPADQRDEWGHGNGIDQMPNEDLLISFRNINSVMIIDRASGDIAWELGPPVLAQQHHPVALDENTITIFDNGAHKLRSALPSSRVIDVDIATKEIVREYADSPVTNFLSPFISGAQRLPNGNTLVTEGNYGRIFEVTAENQIVWEFVNPFFFVNNFLGENNNTFRAFRYGPELFPQLA